MSRPTILCVDDEPTVLVSLREQLRRRFGRSHGVEVAESGDAALELLAELRAESVIVPVVVSDQIMPGMQGDELLERIEHDAPDIKKIMLTGQASAEAVGNAVNRANLFRYLGKPWAESDLALTVKSALDAFEARERLEQQRATLSDLHALALDLTSTVATQDRYARLVARLSSALDVPRIALFGMRRGALRRLAAFGPSADETPRFVPATPGGALALALASGETLRGSSSEAGALLTTELGWGEAKAGLVAVPLRAEGEVTGLLVLGSHRELDALTDERVRGYGALTAASLRTAGLIDALELASERQRQIASVLLREADGRSVGPMQGTSAAIRATLATLEQLARDDAAFLLSGASGTGHESAARHVHRTSARADGPFLTVQGAAVQQPALLGVRDTSSMAWLAHGGTLYVAGAERLQLPAQEELMRTLRRVGEPDAPNVRIVLSTHAVDEVTLRSVIDGALLERLPARVVLPPLRERLEDIPVLARFYLRAHASRVGRAVSRLPEGADEILGAYPWPGNVEELERVMERSVLTATGPVAALERGMLDAVQKVGSYRLLERLGAGGMGEVWKARHEHLQRPAAIKLIHPTTNKNAQDQANERFRREAGATARLLSPHTVELYDFGVSDNGDLYYVMELLDGIDLHTLVTETGPLPAERVVHLLLQACHSLVEAHEAGLVHRDIKPANLFVCRYGSDLDFLKVLDFGMVTGGGDPSLTDPGAVPGTPATLAPETLREATDHRSDLYSLGCTAYFLLAGRHVFLSRLPAILLDHLSTPPTPVSAVTKNPIPPELETIVMSLLAKDPADRPQSARALREALRSVPVERAWTDERAAAWWPQLPTLRASRPPSDALATTR